MLSFVQKNAILLFKHERLFDADECGVQVRAHVALDIDSHFANGDEGCVEKERMEKNRK